MFAAPATFVFPVGVSREQATLCGSITLHLVGSPTCVTSRSTRYGARYGTLLLPISATFDCNPHEGARQGAPDARQVADRFHLVQNVGEHLERILIRRHAALREAARPNSPPPLAPPTPIAAPRSLAAPLPQARRASRQVRYDEVRHLLAQGHSQRTVACILGLSRDTVSRFARVSTFPERAARSPRPTILTPYEPYLRMRWAAGDHNAHTLWAEIRARGYPGSASNLRRSLGRWRTLPAPYGRPARQFTAEYPPPSPVRTFTPRQTRWLLLAPPERLDAEERAYLIRLTGECPEVVRARDLVQRFLTLIRNREEHGLESWLADAEASGIPELGGFVRGLRRDRTAVNAALTTDVSNGQTEGFVNKLNSVS